MCILNSGMIGKDAIIISCKAVPKQCQVTMKGQGTLSPSVLLDNSLVQQTDKGMLYQRAAVSLVITFTVHNISERCKGTQLATEIVADMNNEWTETCVKAPEETTEQRLKQWHMLITKSIVNSHETGKHARHPHTDTEQWLATRRQESRRMASRSC